MTFSRRSFVHLVGAAGGAGAAYATLVAMGLMPTPASAYAGPPRLPEGSGRGRRVIVLGAGLAGMTAAYELGRAGYACTVLEAGRRPGGRSLTLRAGDRVTERGGPQTADWRAASHMYANMGPARIPHHHRAVLGYCRDFGVPLEAFVNENRAAYYHDAAFGGRRPSQRQVAADLRGALAELLAKAVGGGALDQAVSPEDKERLRAMLRAFGALDGEGRYRGSSRAGFATPPGAYGEAGTALEPLPLRALLDSQFWRFQTQFAEEWHQAATMLQPVGGMDAITRAFAERLGDAIVTGATVEELRKVAGGARVIYRRNGVRRAIEAPQVICTLPLSVLADVQHDLEPAHAAAVRAARYVKAVKIAFAAGRRFWEEEGLYGGISWTSGDATQMWYPSHGFHRQRGVVIGAYIWSDAIGERVGAMPFAERLAFAGEAIGTMHPGAREHLGRGVSVAWANMPLARGAWAEWRPQDRATHYATLCRPDGPIHFAGEHMSHLTGWQEGAILSAHEAVRAVAAAA
jgi:monoamine oxidase